MVAFTAFATRFGGSVCPEMPWSVCPETVGQLAPKWCGLIHHNLHADNTGEIRESADEIAVRQMFEFIIDTTIGLEKAFQVIITDHAFLNTDKFKGHVQEIWRDGVKLIPEDWYNEQQ